MPRLLLVDDNPSIHRIAESLLAPTDIELTCADSAEDALDRLERGERFDVALVDTVMPGMDGWTLLSKLRTMEATAHLPIALMAGVLDPVDPAKLAKAPIQGFLKKPIELRELGDRVKALLLMPVVAQAEVSPYATLPGTSIKDLALHPETPLPEFRPDPLPEIPEMSASAAMPEVESDLLVLGPEDLWPEEAVEVVTAPVPEFEPLPESLHEPLPEPLVDLSVDSGAEVQLELEELDLESLQDLTEEPLENELEALPEPVSELDFTETPAVTLPAHEAVVLPDSLEDDSLDLLLDEVAAPAVGGLIPAAAGQPVEVVEPVEAVEPLVPMALPAGGSISQVQAQAVLQALLAEPVLMDALVKALVTRMGDQVLREIAWEVMPDLAGRLQR